MIPRFARSQLDRGAGEILGAGERDQWGGESVGESGIVRAHGRGSFFYHSSPWGSHSQGIELKTGIVINPVANRYECGGATCLE